LIEKCRGRAQLSVVGTWYAGVEGDMSGCSWSDSALGCIHALSIEFVNGMIMVAVSI